MVSIAAVNIIGTVNILVPPILSPLLRHQMPSFCKTLINKYPVAENFVRRMTVSCYKGLEDAGSAAPRDFAP
jgi:hypothetical protein